MRLMAMFLLAVATCFGQASAVNGQIEGTILDPSGAPVTGTDISALNEGTGFRQKVQTEASGLYRFNVLPLGTYEISIDAAGFAPVKRNGIVLTAGLTARVDVTLSLKGTATEVQVTGDAPIAEPSRTDIGLTLTQNQVTNLPLVSRNPYNFILLQPNVSGHPNTEFGVPRKLDVNGFNGRINYQIDGSNNTESDRAGIRLIPISDTYVQGVQQVNNGFAPEFGNTVGSVYNAITKSGSNDLHGEAGYLFRRTDFNSRPKLLQPTQATPSISVDSFLVDVGGRLIKDKLFFFGAFEHVKRDLPSVVSVSAATVSSLGLPANYAAAIPFSQSLYFYMFKGDWQINQNNRAALRYSHHSNDSPFNNGGAQVLLPLTYNFIDRSHVGAAQVVSTISANAVNELRFQVATRSQSQNSFAASGTGPTINIAGVAQFGGPNQVGFVYTETLTEGSDNFSVNRGTHALKFGVDIRAINDTQVQATSATYNFPNAGAYLAAVAGTNTRGYSTFVQLVGNPNIKYDSLFSGGYAQDSWKPRANLTLTYGVRYDLYRVPQAARDSLFPMSQSFRKDKNNLAPRLGIAYAVNAKTVIRVNGGMFYDPPQTDQYRKAILNNGSPIFFSVTARPGDAFGPSFPNVFTAAPQGFSLPTQDITTVSRDFRTLYSYNANFTIAREITTNTSISATYLFTHGVGLPVYRNINLISSGQTLADGRPTFGAGRVFPAFNNIISAESVGTSLYNGASLSLTHRISHGLEFNGTYTWSHALDDAPEQNNIDSGAFFLSDPLNRRRDRGNSLTDRRHAFNGNLVQEWKGFRLSSILTMQSGDVFNLGSNKNLNGDGSAGAAFQRPLFVGRNTLRAPAVYEWNLRFSRSFRFKERARLEAFAESTNVLNHDNITGIAVTALVDSTGAILTPATQAHIAALDQRLIQLGFKFVF